MLTSPWPPRPALIIENPHLPDLASTLPGQEPRFTRHSEGVGNSLRIIC